MDYFAIYYDRVDIVMENDINDDNIVEYFPATKIYEKDFLAISKLYGLEKSANSLLKFY